MTAVGRAAADSQKEEATAAFPQVGQFPGHFLNNFMIQGRGDLPDLVQIRLCVCHR